MFQTILVPTDFSDCAAAATGAAGTLAAKFGAKIVLAHVAEPAFNYARYGLPQEVIDARLQEDRDAIDERFATAKQQFPQGVEVETAVFQGNAADEICAAATDRKIDLIVMSTHGHTGLRHFMVGSTTERVVRQAPCPVLTVRAEPAD